MQALTVLLPFIWARGSGAMLIPDGPSHSVPLPRIARHRPRPGRAEAVLEPLQVISAGLQKHSDGHSGTQTREEWFARQGDSF